MNPELVLKFMSQEGPWAFGCRDAVCDTKDSPLGDLSTQEFPYFASRGPEGNRFTTVGSDLEECLDVCLNTPPAIPAQAVDPVTGASHGPLTLINSGK